MVSPRPVPPNRRDGCFGLLKGFKDPFELPRRDADARIRDGERNHHRGTSSDALQPHAGGPFDAQRFCPCSVNLNAFASRFLRIWSRS